MTLLLPFSSKVKELSSPPAPTRTHGGFPCSNTNGQPSAIMRNAARWEDKCFHLGGNASPLAADYDSLGMRASTVGGFNGFNWPLRKCVDDLFRLSLGVLGTGLVQSSCPDGLWSLPGLWYQRAEQELQQVGTSDAHSCSVLSTYCVPDICVTHFT